MGQGLRSIIDAAHERRRIRKQRELAELISRYNSLDQDSEYGKSLVQAAADRGDTAATTRLSADQVQMSVQLAAMRDTILSLGGTFDSRSAPETPTADLIRDEAGDSALISHSPVQYVLIAGSKQPVFFMGFFESAGIRWGLLVLDCSSRRTASFGRASSLTDSELIAATWRPAAAGAASRALELRFCDQS